ncbi:MAG TPA: hypothetical protein VFN39_10885 [Gemmatimonadaceae bacterium]|nr:hypothetical protein [Gemmatimonadaceae bacterium]
MSDMSLKRRRFFRWIVLGAVPVIATCAKIPSLEPIARAGADILGASEGIKRAGVSAESAAVSLRKGLEGLDPAGIRTLLSTNDKLRGELERVQKLYLQGMGQGVVDITGRNVQIRVTRTAGDLIINAWIDKPENQFWSGRITNREVQLPVDIETFLRDYPSRRCRGQTGVAATACLGAAQRVAPAAAAVLVQEEFQRYLRTAPATPAADLPPSIANPRFGGSGEHKVYFEVVPVKADANGSWAARLEIWLVDGQGKQANVFVYDVDDRRYPKHRMEEPVPPVVATLVVRTASENPAPEKTASER